MKKILILLIIMAIPAVMFAQIGWVRQNIDLDFDGACSVYAIDLDGDSYTDVLGAAFNADDIVWWENDGNGNFTKRMIVDNFDGATSVFAIDLDDDTDIDVLGAAFNDDDITWWENDGNENFTERKIKDNFNGAHSVFATDIDGDEDIDVIGAAQTAGDVLWWENDGNENFTEHIISTSITNAYDVYAADLDNDMDKDVVVASHTGVGGGNIIWWENTNGLGTNWNMHAFSTPYNNAAAVFAIDLDDDEDNDILGVASPSGAMFLWWKNEGSGNFVEDTIGSGLYGTDVYAIDIDQDADIDAISSSNYVISWWENDDDENFVEHQIAGALSQVRSIFAIDMDDDTDIDVLAAIENEDGIAWWKNCLITTYNVGPISIDIPDTVPYDTTLHPHATVENFGQNTETFNVTCTIEPGAYNSTTVCHLGPDESGPVTFPDPFTFFQGGTYTVTVYTKLQGDELPNNDTLEKTIEVPISLDVGPISIDIPGTLPIDTTLYPKVTVENFGTNTENFSVVCKINPGLYNRIEYIDLAPGEILQVTFGGSFTFELDTTYNVIVFTRLDGDEYPENDTLEKIIDTYMGVAEGNANLPVTFSFGLKNNPAKGKVVFNLALPEPALITLNIYDISGRLIDRVITDRKSAGYYEIPWTPKTTAGVYFYTLDSPWQTKVGKLVILR